MKLYAISDLHLAKSNKKPMDIFGDKWKNHEQRICKNWSSTINDEDIVLIPGDLSWAMNLDDAYIDLYDVMTLPGRKVFIRGNHDFWWNGIGKVRSKFSCFKNVYFLQNDSITIDGISFAGSRGWLCPQSSEFKKEKDEPIYERELYRMELSISRMQNDIPKVVLMHYPPFTEEKSGFTELFEKYGINNVVYGHLHGCSVAGGFIGEHNGVYYNLCSADAIGFHPIEIKLNIK